MSMLETNENAHRHGRSEDMFLAWFFSLPESTDVAEAARVAIARIDKSALPCEQVARLRTMLVQASYPQPATSRSRRRQRH
ncbi:MAG: hypothetical protein JWL86_6356 [Rhizobium sp.]|nr:hypothetical protein [Rhizobium sp.]